MSRSKADADNRRRWALLHRTPELAMERRDREHLYPVGFFRWLERNPQLFLEFQDKALQVRSMGRDRFAARIIVEGIRWHTLLADKDATFKVNNNWIPGMARLCMALNPALVGMFELRRERAGMAHSNGLEVHA